MAISTFFTFSIAGYCYQKSKKVVEKHVNMKTVNPDYDPAPNSMPSESPDIYIGDCIYHSIIILVRP